MIPRRLHRIPVSVLALATLVVSACEKAPLLAPTGSTITLTTATNVVAANGTAQIVAQVIESGGTPPHSGTRVTFTTTLGTIEPSETSTDTAGRAIVTFRANGANGIAIIAAYSGGSTTSTGGSSGGTGTGGTGGTTTGSGDRNLRIAVGTAAVGRVIISANPAVLPTAGGTTNVIANVLDINGNALTGAPVTFTTSAGTLSSPVVNTDATGNASVLLTTFQQSVVTAAVGLGSSGGGSTGGGTGSGGSTGGGTTGTSNTQAQLTVALTSAPTLAITPPTTPPSAGLPASFTFRVTPASASGSGGGGTGGGGGGTGGGGTIPIRELVVDFGDGTIRNLGAVSGEQSVAHTYRSPGSYTITGTVTDVAGGTARVSTSTSVIAVPRPSVIVTPTPASGPNNTPVSFRIEIAAPQGLNIQNVLIDFGDGTSQTLGGASGVLTVSHTYTTATAPTAGNTRAFNITVTVTDSSGQTTFGTTVFTMTANP